MAANPYTFHVILRAGLPRPEYNLLKLYGQELVDKEGGERLILFRCTTFEIADGAFAKVAAVDPEDETRSSDLRIPLSYILLVSDLTDEQPAVPFGFTLE